MIYLDNNATTALSPEVLEVMLPFFREHFGNPSSPHSFARAPALAVAKAREQVAGLIGATPEQVVFTSGGTESNAMAIESALAARPDRHDIFFSAVEHASVWAWRERLAARGYSVHLIPVDRSGQLDLDWLRARISETTALVSVMLANNETGVMYPVRDVAVLAHSVGALVHTDAVQACGKIAVELRDLGVDYAAVCGHKMHADKGIGAIFIKNRAVATALLPGGEQERGLRSGTEPVAAIAGFGQAAELAAQWLTQDGPEKMKLRRDEFESALLTTISGVHVIGAGQPRLPNTTQVIISGVETEPLLARLDMEGIACSSGSACASGAHEPSHVLKAMGFESHHGAVLRISASRYTADEDYQILIKALPKVVISLRG